MGITRPDAMLASGRTAQPHQLVDMASFTLLRVKKMVRTMEGVETADQVLLMDGTVLENSEELLPRM